MKKRTNSNFFDEFNEIPEVDFAFLEMALLKGVINEDVSDIS
jgi:hypothetical protein